MTSLILSGIEHASLSSRSAVNAYQPSFSISNNWSALLGRLSLRFWSRMLHRFSIGFKSGDCDGQSNLVTTGYSCSLPQSLPPARIRWHHFDVCLGSLSCCQKTSLGPPKRRSIDGKAQLTRIFPYWTCSIRPSTLWNIPTMGGKTPPHHNLDIVFDSAHTVFFFVPLINPAPHSFLEIITKYKRTFVWKNNSSPLSYRPMHMIITPFKSPFDVALRDKWFSCCPVTLELAAFFNSSYNSPDRYW